MSFIYHDRNDDDYAIGLSEKSFRPIVVVVTESEKERLEKRIEKQQRDLENFYCGGL